MKSPLEWVQDLFGGQCVAYQIIEDVERGAELSFSGPLRGPCIIRQILFSNDQILVSDRQTDRRTDGQTDGQTDAINIFWAFLVKN